MVLITPHVTLPTTDSTFESIATSILNAMANSLLFCRLLNAYDNVNVSNYDHETRSDVPFKYDKYPETWFGITPFVGVSWEF